MTIPIALTIAGSDSGGGAGIQADIKTMSALGVYSASVITALTAQNTTGVTAVHDVDPAFIAEQIDAVCSDLNVRAAKIGMLHRTDVIQTVAQALERHSIGHIVLDPVMVAKSGDPLLHDDAIDALKSMLIPIASIITPNIPEAARLLRRKEEFVYTNKEAATERLLSLGCGSILLKGGHDHDTAESTDLYFDGNNFRYMSSPRVDTRNTHGTGCSLSSAICAELAKKQGMESAVFIAKQYISQAIACADVLDVGTGHGPIHHFHHQWN
ncbi:MAG: bifunctional hydroxymethylpyrimidine kinase/phosphomethylpyrimidine kinase [Acidiferrobacterales bacterium]|nr:bifunctional hydroxymethylpyrimidine kinase/phosphomethylpyrimidine kinase [Acidiferrobacterales bacterium]